ncbi:MAG TPA: metallophosphoesterase [Allosphingosinicella sp.]|nr:metallophosphoesterase [Allosphingosinicella sp.]
MTLALRLRRSATLAPLLLLLAAAAEPQPPPSGQFLALSDVHFDPFADPAIVPRLIAAEADQWPAIFAAAKPAPPVGAGSDTNYALFESTLRQAAAAGGRDGYDFVLVTGDLLRHDFEETFVKYGGSDKDGLQAFAAKTVTYVNRAIERRVRGAPLIEALGNNDNDCGDYQPRPGSPLLAAIARSLPAVAADPQAAQDFTAGGNYAVRHPKVADHLFLIVDSVYWSTRYEDACGTAGGDPGSAQLAWLEWQLFRARLGGKTVSLVMHIPPGFNPYESTAAKPAPFWVDSYRDRFLALADAYAPVLVAGYAGHTHMDDFRLVSTAAGPSLPIRITPSVTPLFGNNPSFAVMRYGRGDARPLDYTAYALQRGAWRREYSFSQAYGYPAYSPANLAALSGAIRAGGAPRASYGRYYASGAKSPITDGNASVYACAQTELLPAGFAACLGQD